MNNRLITLTIASVVGLGIYAGLSNASFAPKVGKVMLHHGAAMEARLSGYEKKQVMSGGINYTLFEGGNPQGPAIVMLHGYSAEKNVFLRFGKHFLNEYRVIIPDLAGHGETGFSTDWTYDIPTQSQRVAGLMTDLGIDKFHVMGNSMGGFITATLAADYPERVLSAVPIDPAGIVSPVRSDMEKMFMQGRNPFLFNTRDEFDEFYAMTMAKPPLLPDAVLDAMAAEYIERRPELQVIHEHFAGKNMLTDRLGEIKAPFLLVWGAKDQLLHVSAVDVWMNGVSHGRSFVFEDLGHMPMLEDPDATAAVVKQFVDEVEDSRSL